jgi:hypothetical protein
MYFDPVRIRARRELRPHYISEIDMTLKIP